MKTYLLFLLPTLLFLASCDLDDPTEGIQTSDIITLKTEQSNLLANGKDRIVLTAELGPKADANQTVTFRTEAGFFPAADDPGSQEFTVTASNKTATVVLESDRIEDDEVEVTAEIGDFKAISFLTFERAYPDDLLVSADKALIDADRVDFANVTVELFRNIGQPSIGTRVDFMVVELDTAKAQVKDFAFSDDQSTVSVQVRSANSKPGEVQVLAKVRNQQGTVVTKMVELVFQ